ncbi:MAG: hypothetical protein QXL82_02115 [Candidatus Aenigmatarchaeota archaeon]
MENAEKIKIKIRDVVVEIPEKHLENYLDDPIVKDFVNIVESKKYDFAWRYVLGMLSKNMANCHMNMQ